MGRELGDSGFLPPERASSNGVAGANGSGNGHQGPGAPEPKKPRSKLATILAIFLLVLGVLLVAEAALTVFWKEPFTAFKTGQTQGSLGDELDELSAGDERAAAGPLEGRGTFKKSVQEKAASLSKSRGIGSALGRLEIDKLDLNYVVVQGTDEATLQKGPGHYPETPLPGVKGKWTVGIAGHRTTYDAPFRHIDNLSNGDEISLTMPYARFTYVVQETKIVDAGAQDIFQPGKENRLALTACHPLHSDAQRIIVYSKLKSEEPLDAKSLASLPDSAKTKFKTGAAVALEVPPPKLGAVGGAAAKLKPRPRKRPPALAQRSPGERPLTQVPLTGTPTTGEPDSRAGSGVGATAYQRSTGAGASTFRSSSERTFGMSLVVLFIVGFSGGLVGVGCSAVGLTRANGAERGNLMTTMVFSALVIAGLVLAFLGVI